MNEIQVFSNEEFGEVRTLKLYGQVWFVGVDVAGSLGYSNASKAVSTHVDDNDRIIEMMAHSQNGNVVKTQTAVINESGLYSLILASKLPTAKKFKRWVTSEVLPSIRLNGRYEQEKCVKNVDNDGSKIEIIKESFSPSEVLKAMEIIASCPADRVGTLKDIADKYIEFGELNFNSLVKEVGSVETERKHRNKCAYSKVNTLPTNIRKDVIEMLEGEEFTYDEISTYCKETGYPISRASLSRFYHRNCNKH